MQETLRRMIDNYKLHVAKLKEDWKNGETNLCERGYKIQLNIWEKRIKEYEGRLNEKTGEKTIWQRQ